MDSLFHTSHILQLLGSWGSHRMYREVLHLGTLLVYQLACCYQLGPSCCPPLSSTPPPSPSTSSPGDAVVRLVCIKHWVDDRLRAGSNSWICITRRFGGLDWCYNFQAHKWLDSCWTWEFSNCSLPSMPGEFNPLDYGFHNTSWLYSLAIACSLGLHVLAKDFYNLLWGCGEDLLLI